MDIQPSSVQNKLYLPASDVKACADFWQKQIGVVLLADNPDQHLFETGNTALEAILAPQYISRSGGIRRSYEAGARGYVHRLGGWKGRSESLPTRDLAPSAEGVHGCAAGRNHSAEEPGGNHAN